MGLKKTEQKEYAKFLYTEKSFSQKEIAEKAAKIGRASCRERV